MKFYRYETREYASLDMDGEYEPSPYPNPKLEVTEFSLLGRHQRDIGLAMAIM